MGGHHGWFHYPNEQMFGVAFRGELAQRESTALAAQGSGVQIPYSPPRSLRLSSAVRRRLGAFVVYPSWLGWQPVHSGLWRGHGGQPASVVLRQFLGNKESLCTCFQHISIFNEFTLFFLTGCRQAAGIVVRQYALAITEQIQPVLDIWLG
jgi:hypothetical protein